MPTRPRLATMGRRAGRRLPARARRRRRLGERRRGLLQLNRPATKDPGQPETTLVARWLGRRWRRSPCAAWTTCRRWQLQHRRGGHRLAARSRATRARGGGPAAAAGPGAVTVDWQGDDSGTAAGARGLRRDRPRAPPIAARDGAGRLLGGTAGWKVALPGCLYFIPSSAGRATLGPAWCSSVERRLRDGSGLRAQKPLSVPLPGSPGTGLPSQPVRSTPSVPVNALGTLLVPTARTR